MAVHFHVVLEAVWLATVVTCRGHWVGVVDGCLDEEVSCLPILLVPPAILQHDECESE